ncbi:hypothetical protein [Nonomuraea sp. NPDC049709]|uniref:hypothetical protein n=1 Tax=Nonomuraea sp. NPDC049709 TaxID=3154736 RepID=UPI0034436089
MTDDFRFLISAEIESLPRHPEARYAWNPNSARETLRARNRLVSEAEQLTDEDIERQTSGTHSSSDASTDGAWSLALSIASVFLIEHNRPDLLAVLDRCYLAISRADRWSTLRTAVDDTVVISMDYGLMGALSRVGRYLGFYWKWSRLLPGRVYSRERLIPSDVMERIFRVYFRDLRYNGYFSYSNHVLEPRCELTNVAIKLSATFILLHELSHELLRADDSLFPSPHNDEELICDALASTMLATLSTSPIFRGVEPGVTAIAVRHFFLTLRLIDDAIYMVRPQTHPHPLDREEVAMDALLRALGPSGAHAWSRVVYRPLSALADLTTLAPPWLDMDVKLSSVFTFANNHFVLDDRSPSRAMQVDIMEYIDCEIHRDPDLMASDLISIINKLLSSGGSLAGCPAELVEMARNRNASAEIGWEWVDRFLQLNSAIMDKIWSLVPKDGLTYCGCDLYREFDNLARLRYLVWALCHYRRGWISMWRTGLRNWGTNVNHEIPRAMWDLSWVIRDEPDMGRRNSGQRPDLRSWHGATWLHREGATGDNREPDTGR